MKKQGFTIIELLIVIAIISILVGVAVPYYNDYITDARLSVLKQNIATFRNTVNQFRGDNLRGPFAVPVNIGGANVLVDPLSGNTTGSELIVGPIQVINNVPQRRANISYLPSMPVFTDPFSGGNITPPAISTASPSAFFYDRDGNGIFELNDNGDADPNADSDFAFLDGNNDKMYNATTDTILFYDSKAAYGGTLPPGVAKALDYTHVTVTDSTGITY